MERIELALAKREILGKKVRFLRRQGITPVHLFGHGIESLALQCETAELKQVLAQAGRTKLIDLKLDKKNPKKAVVREVQHGPKTSELLHVDFYQVRMEEKIKVEVPIILIGEAPALKLKENMLEHYLTHLIVECFPDEIPADIELDLSPLTEIEDVIRVQDIHLGEKITILNEPEMAVVRISERPVEKVEEEVVEEEVEVEAAEAAEEAPTEEAQTKENKEE